MSSNNTIFPQPLKDIILSGDIALGWQLAKGQGILGEYMAEVVNTYSLESIVPKGDISFRGGDR